jgi:hypothetical protein
MHQDFMQVLSMFANFGFAWPPAITSLFNLFSLVNFNFELLAPECSVSLDFEAKWCVVVHLMLCKVFLADSRGGVGKRQSSSGLGTNLG